MGAENASLTRRALGKLARERRPLAVTVTIGLVVGIALAIGVPRQYVARTLFYPESRSNTDVSSALGGLGGLGALAGALTGGLGLGPTPAAFFVDLIKSEAFLDTLAVSRIRPDSTGRSLTVEEYLIRRADTPLERRWKVRKKLRKVLTLSILPGGVVAVEADTRSRFASAQLANRAVEVLDDLNIELRRRQAVARRRFTQQFRDNVDDRLTEAEQRLETFLEANRSLSGSPVLLQRAERLRAEVSRLANLRDQLESNIENARLTEYNSAPVVARVDQATPPARPSGPPRILFVVGTVVLAAMLRFARLLWLLKVPE